jgi:hypothetical protein
MADFPHAATSASIAVRLKDNEDVSVIPAGENFPVYITPARIE